MIFLPSLLVECVFFQIKLFSLETLKCVLFLSKEIQTFPGAGLDNVVVATSTISVLSRYKNLNFQKLVMGIDLMYKCTVYFSNFQIIGRNVIC